MTTPTIDFLIETLQLHFKPREEGWAWLALHDDDHPGVVSEITGEYEGAVETAAALANIITGVGAVHAFLALCRASGRPTEADRRLWRHLREHVASDVLVDMVVFNDSAVWSMRAEDSTSHSIL